MNEPNPRQFADLLSNALRQIKKLESKPIHVIQDEVGYALGRGGGSVIESWRKGEIMPHRMRDVEQLASILVTRGKLPSSWFDEYAQANGYHTELAALRARLYPGEREQSGTAQSAPFQAPMLVPHLVGRRTLLAITGDSLQQQRPQTIALVGMGGMGKTTLAIHLAHGLRDVFVDGILWASAATSDPADIIEQWARVYGYDLSSLHDVQNRAAALRGMLATRQSLLIFDDVTYASDIRPLIPGGGDCAVLLTTRNEEVAVALSARIIHVGELSMGESLELLAAIIGADRLIGEQAAARQICGQLQHLPLALEITGQLLKTRPSRRLADMASHLESISHRLNLRIHDRAVRTSFAASWTNLDEPHRAAFAWSGVFAGRVFGAEALGYIAGLDLFAAQERLYTLKAFSLINEVAPDRFQQHPLLAAFANEKLSDSADRDLRIEQFVRYYSELAGAHREQDDLLESEWENITAAMDTASSLGLWDALISFGRALTGYWSRQARFAQARQGYRLMYDAAAASGELEAQAFALHKWGWACLEQDDYAEATQHLEASIRHYQLLKDDQACADAYFGLARSALERALYDEAHGYVAQYLPICERLGDLTGIAHAYHQRAYLAYHVGDLQLTSDLNQKAYDIQVSQGNSPEILPTLRLMIDVAIEQQQYADAETYCRQALEIAQALQNRGEIAATYYCMVVVARMQQQFDQALDYSDVAQEMFERMGDQGFLALVLYEQSRVYLLDGEPQQAKSAVEDGIVLFRRLENRFALVYALNHYGRIELALGDCTEAQAIWSEALEIAAPLAHPLVSELRRQLEDSVCA